MQPDPAAAPLIVSALFAPTDLAWLDGLRRAHFPPERNLLAAHLTLFHALPPSAEDELKSRLAEASRGPRPDAQASALMNLGRGTAIRILSPDLERIRAELADAFGLLLTPQDRAGWRPHVTVQNKVSPEDARALQRMLGEDFRPRPIVIAALAVWRYRGGPWEPVSRHPFRG
ncbi:2'-5' RNA ligase family protein [uncultured Sphingomonas sp.]|uniref:2'-5' RNA ligase family protein n=1 Tax=uncultured Sphingomonas sp. TaxID=158754 RepID=UPI0025DB5E8E|nr:2'-5' RNA ligase family protein [uncultured Sphingomonas sp.]